MWWREKTICFKIQNDNSSLGPLDGVEGLHLIYKENYVCVFIKSQSPEGGLKGKDETSKSLYQTKTESKSR